MKKPYVRLLLGLIFMAAAFAPIAYGDYIYTLTPEKEKEIKEEAVLITKKFHQAKTIKSFRYWLTCFKLTTYRYGGIGEYLNLDSIEAWFNACAGREVIGLIKYLQECREPLKFNAGVKKINELVDLWKSTA